MQSMEKLFAVVDRKIDAFDFTVKKVKGKTTGNEYYAVSAECIINGEKFEKRVLTIGCPGKAVEIIVKAMLASFGVKPAVAVTLAAEVAPGLTKEVAKGITLTPVKEEVEEVAPGLTLVEEVDEDAFELVDDDECEECDEEDCVCAECTAEEPTSGISLSLHTDRKGPQDCPYCGAKVAPNFAYCPMCGGQQ